MFCGAGGPEIAKSDRAGGKSAAVIYCLIRTAKLNGIDPESSCDAKRSLWVGSTDSSSASPKPLNDQAVITQSWQKLTSNGHWEIIARSYPSAWFVEVRTHGVSRQTLARGAGRNNLSP
jgi:hypothetical protein